MSDEKDGFSEAELLEVRPALLDAIDTLYNALLTGVSFDDYKASTEHLRKIEQIIGRRP